jgi:hypothetical protein
MYLINYTLLHADIWDSDGIATPFLTSTLDEGEWSASSPGRFTSGEIVSCTHWIRGSVGPRAGLDVMEKRNNSPLPGIEPQSSNP